VRACSNYSAGYIGSELVKRLLALDDLAQIVQLDRNLPKVSLAIVPFFPVELSEIAATDLSKRLEGTDALFHLAAARTDWGRDYSAYERDNVRATRRLIEAGRMAGIRQWIYFSTVGVYGPCESPLDEDAPFAPQSDYARTKAQAEGELVAAAEAEGWTLRILRPSAVFSEDQPDNTNIHRLIDAIRRHRFVLIGDGSEIKTTSYLHNVVDAALWLYQDLDSGGVAAYNYVDEPRLSTREMVDLVRQELRVRILLVRLPAVLIERPARVIHWLGEHVGHDFPITAARIRKFCSATNVDSSRIRRAGFLPRYTSREALVRTVQWYRSRTADKGLANCRFGQA
jgi:nucleoside-diphosphate-sugar epimerase